MGFTSICFSLGCCCGAEHGEAPIEENVSVRVSKAVHLTSALSSQKGHCVRGEGVSWDTFSSWLTSRESNRTQHCWGVGHVQNHISVHGVTTSSSRARQKALSSAVWPGSHLKTAAIPMYHGSLVPLVRLENASSSALRIRSNWLLIPRLGKRNL